MARAWCRLFGALALVLATGPVCGAAPPDLRASLAGDPNAVVRAAATGNIDSTIVESSAPPAAAPAAPSGDIAERLTDLCVDSEYSSGDGGADFKVFRWNGADGPLTPSRLLEHRGLLKVLSSDESGAWWNDREREVGESLSADVTVDDIQQTRRAFEDALRLMQQKLRSVERLAVRVAVGEVHGVDYAWFLAGQVADGSWVGVGPDASPASPAGGASAQGSQLSTSIAPAGCILGDAFGNPTRVGVAWQSAPTRGELLDRLLARASGPDAGSVQLATRSAFCGFGVQPEDDERDPAAPIEEFLARDLTDVWSYELGGWETYEVIAAGKTPDGEVLGVTTTQHRPQG